MDENFSSSSINNNSINNNNNASNTQTTNFGFVKASDIANLKSTI